MSSRSVLSLTRTRRRGSISLYQTAESKRSGKHCACTMAAATTSRRPGSSCWSACAAGPHRSASSRASAGRKDRRGSGVGGGDIGAAIWRPILQYHRLMMTEPSDHDDAPEERPRPRSRSIYLLPNLLTTGALFSGFYGIVAAIDKHL